MKRIVLFAVLSVSVALYSCKAQYHINKAEKHREKALKKGAVFTTKKDTLYLTDTLTRIELRNDTVFVTNTVTKIITEEGEIRFITRSDKRKERRLQERIRRDSVKLLRLQARLDKRIVQTQERNDTKRERIKNRSSWSWWIVVLLIVSFVVYLFATNKKK